MNVLMQQYGLNTIRATGFADDWFKALTAAGSPVKFHNARQHPFGLSSPRDISGCAEGFEQSLRVGDGQRTHRPFAHIGSRFSVDEAFAGSRMVAR